MSGCFTFSAFHIGLDGWRARRRFGELKRLSPLCLHARVCTQSAAQRGLDGPTLGGGAASPRKGIP